MYTSLSNGRTESRATVLHHRYNDQLIPHPLCIDLLGILGSLSYTIPFRIAASGIMFIVIV